MDADARESRSGHANWYVAATRPSMEDLAERELGQQGFQAFLPRVIKSVRHARKLSTRRAALFPGYIFVRLDLGRERWRSINGTRGVRALVSDRERPLPLPAGFAEHLIEATGEGGVVDWAPQLNEGDQVRLVGGPFADLLAVLDRMDAGGRVRVLIKIMNGEIGLTTDLRNVAPARMKEWGGP